MDILKVTLERFTVDNPTKEPEKNERPVLSRRNALIKLGLAVGVTTYVAPLVTGLDKANAASSCPWPQHLVHGMCQ